MGRGGSLVDSSPFVRGVAGSNPALAATMLCITIASAPPRRKSALGMHKEEGCYHRSVVLYCIVVYCIVLYARPNAITSINCTILLIANCICNGKGCRTFSRETPELFA